MSAGEVEELKLKAVDAKNKLKDLHQKDAEKYAVARMEAEKAAKIAERNLKAAQSKLDSEHSELKDLEKALEAKTKQVRIKILKGHISSVVHQFYNDVCSATRCVPSLTLFVIFTR